MHVRDILLPEDRRWERGYKAKDLHDEVPPCKEEENMVVGIPSLNLDDPNLKELHFDLFEWGFIVDKPTHRLIVYRVDFRKKYYEEKKCVEEYKRVNAEMQEKFEAQYVKPEPEG